MQVICTFIAECGFHGAGLCFRVLDHFKKQKVKPYDRQQVISALPFELRCKILKHLYAGAIHSVPLLHRMADDEVFLTDVCLRMQSYSCSARTFLYQRGEFHCIVLCILPLFWLC